MTRVLQNQGHQSAARLRAVDRPFEPLRHQAGQQARVIQMGVSEKNRSELVGFVAKGPPVVSFQFFVSLVEATVHENVGVTPLQEGTATRYRTARAAKSDSPHGRKLLSIIRLVIVPLARSATGRWVTVFVVVRWWMVYL